MFDKDSIINMAKSNNGYVTSSMISNAGISRGTLKYLVDKGILLRSSRGVYMMPKAFPDEMFELQSRLKKGVYSLESALYLFDLTDQTPIHYTMTFPKGYNLTSAKQSGLHCIQKEKHLYDIGIIETTSPCGNVIRTYNKERTLCDILLPQAKTSTQIVVEAFKRYVKLKDRNIPLLSSYAKTYGVEGKVRSFLEVLL